jgi:triosephosphate isomerase (TIM)
MRRPLVAGNWKMNPPTLAEALALARDVEAGCGPVEGVTSVVCPPTIWLREVAAHLGGGPVATGAQTMHHDERGAFTGETSPLMLAGVAEFVIVGHSERRRYAGETDEDVAAKVASAVAHGLRPIAAVGERADQRRAGATAEVVERQVHAVVSRLGAIAGSGLLIAYEPVWAIGTGDAASGEDAQEVAAQIRGLLAAKDPTGAEEVPILYGGSVTADNAAEFFGQPDIDGALVGGASLDAAAFEQIARAAAVAGR